MDPCPVIGSCEVLREESLLPVGGEDVLNSSFAETAHYRATVWGYTTPLTLMGEFRRLSRRTFWANMHAASCHFMKAVRNALNVVPFQKIAAYMRCRIPVNFRDAWRSVPLERVVLNADAIRRA